MPKKVELSTEVKSLIKNFTEKLQCEDGFWEYRVKPLLKAGYQKILSQLTPEEQRLLALLEEIDKLQPALVCQSMTEELNEREIRPETWWKSSELDASLKFLKERGVPRSQILAYKKRALAIESTCVDVAVQDLLKSIQEFSFQRYESVRNNLMRLDEEIDRFRKFCSDNNISRELKASPFLRDQKSLRIIAIEHGIRLIVKSITKLKSATETDLCFLAECCTTIDRLPDDFGLTPKQEAKFLRGNIVKSCRSILMECYGRSGQVDVKSNLRTALKLMENNKITLEELRFAEERFSHLLKLHGLEKEYQPGEAGGKKTKPKTKRVPG